MGTTKGTKSRIRKGRLFTLHSSLDTLLPYRTLLPGCADTRLAFKRVS